MRISPSSLLNGRPGRSRPRLGHDRRGSTAIEIALIAPMIVGLILSVVDFSIIFMGRALLESAVREASRIGVTVSGRSREAQFAQMIRDQVQPFIQPQYVTFDPPRAFNTFVDLGEPFADTNNNGVRDGGETYTDVNGDGAYNPPNSRAGSGGPGDIVVYTVRARQQMIVPGLAALLNGGRSGGGPNEIQHIFRIVVRNEP